MQSETASLLSLGHSNKFDGSCLIAALRLEIKEMHFNSRLMTRKLLFLSALVLMLSSCEGTLDDLLGEWDNPAVERNSSTISFNMSSVEKVLGEVPFTIELTNTGDGAVTFSSSDTSVATVNASTGEVTIKGVGSTTIMATLVGDTKSAQYTLKVYALGNPSDYTNGGDPFNP